MDLIAPANDPPVSGLGFRENLPGPWTGPSGGRGSEAVPPQSGGLRPVSAPVSLSLVMTRA